MGKRSNFPRIPKDQYQTPQPAARPLLDYLSPNTSFYEPCVGEGQLVRWLKEAGHTCTGWSDDEVDARAAQYDTGADFFITNPPWDRKLLHPIIWNLMHQKPTWLLFDADWMHTKQSAEYMMYCRRIVSVGRVKWIPDSKMTGKDNCCWYLFETPWVGVGSTFIGR